jgi:hypothetical protein
MRVVGVGLAVVAGVEQPDPGSQLRGDVDDSFAVLEEALRERPAGAVAALDRPDPLGPGSGVLAHRDVAGLVGGEPPGPEPLLVFVDDLDRGRQLVGIDPDDDLLHVMLPPLRVPIWTARWALLLRAGQSLLEPRLVTVTDAMQTDSEPHLQRVGSRMESFPPITWTESGRTPVLTESSRSRVRPRAFRHGLGVQAILGDRGINRPRHSPT